MKVKHIAGMAVKNTSFITKVPALFRMLKQSFSGVYKPGKKNVFIFIFLIAYLVSPIDLIPDALVVFFGIGILDDAAIAYFALSKLFKEVDKFLEWENERVIAVE